MYPCDRDHDISQVVFLLVTYILPLLGLSVTYTYLSRLLWRLQWKSSIISDNDTTSSKDNDVTSSKDNDITSSKDNDRRAKKEMRKVAKMFIVILIIFGVCWLPYHIYFVVLFYYPVG